MARYKIGEMRNSMIGLTAALTPIGTDPASRPYTNTASANVIREMCTKCQMAFSQATLV